MVHLAPVPKKYLMNINHGKKKLEMQPVKFLDQFRDFGPNMTNVRKALSKKINCNENNLVPVVNATIKHRTYNHYAAFCC